MSLNSAPIQKGTRVTVLTGAGVSAESGLFTFRDNGGLWEQYRFEEVATPDAFGRDPRLVWRFYKFRWENLGKASPNPAHYALVKLEASLGDTFTLITQNVDGLHQEAGSRNVIEMHGTLRRCYCVRCGQQFRTAKVNLHREVPRCTGCGGSLRPDIVWFGEMPFGLEAVNETLEHTRIFIVVGTSGTVYPAAQFLPLARSLGARTIGINLEPPQNVSWFDEFYRGRAGDILPELLKQWI